MPRRKRSRDASVRPSGRAAEPRTLNRYRREVVALLGAGHRISSTSGIRLIQKWDKFVRASWRQGRPPCNVADALSKICKHAGTRSSRRDADNPHKGEIFETRAGNRWEVEDVMDKRIKVRRKGHRTEGPFVWGRSTLRGMKSISSSKGRVITHDEGPPEPPTSPKKEGFFSIFSGDPDRRGKKEKDMSFNKLALSPYQRKALLERRDYLSWSEDELERAMFFFSQLANEYKLLGDTDKARKYFGFIREILTGLRHWGFEKKAKTAQKFAALGKKQAEEVTVYKRKGLDMGIVRRDPSRSRSKKIAQKRKPKNPKISAQKQAFVQKKVRLLLKEGYPRLQAFAIAYRMAGVPRPNRPVRHLTPKERKQSQKARRRALKKR